MGARSTVPLEPRPTRELLEEQRVAMLREAYMRGVEEAELMAMQSREREQMNAIALGTAACSFVWLSTTAYYMVRTGRMEDAQKKASEAANALVISREHDLVVERARVSELAAVSESQKNMLEYQQQVQAKSNEQHSALLARFRQLRRQHLRLRTKHQPLAIEVRTLREANGSLNMKFMASTAGAVVMGLIAAGLAISSHGAHGSPTEHVVVETQTEGATVE